VSKTFVASRYNLPIQRDGSLALLFNCRTGGMLSLPSPLNSILDTLFDTGPFQLDELPEEAHGLISELARAGYFVDPAFDEVDHVRRHHGNGLRGLSLCVTILPTMSCNLRCTYCYQVRQGVRMSQEAQDALVEDVVRRIREVKPDALDVDWFGGEPLTAQRVLFALSERLQEVAARHGLPYRASMATNGTLLSETTVQKLVDAGLEEVQVTLDGPREVHDGRRPRPDGGTSFDEVMSGIRTASRQLDVIVRINVDRDTIDGAWEVLDELEANGCFEAGRSVWPYMALVGPLSSVCAHTCDSMMPAPEFYDRVLDFQEAVLERRPNVDLRQFLGVPQPLERACGAQSELSMIVHPDGSVFKCGLEVHEPWQGAGSVGGRYWEHGNYRSWVDHDPFEDEVCAECRYMPLCLGGCVKHNSDPESPYYRDACLYFERFLIPTLLLYDRARTNALN